jgi:hypothetical protein
MPEVNEDQLNLAIRKFLKQVGVTSQREIESAVRAAAAGGSLPAGGVRARVTLELPDLDVQHVVEEVLQTG